MKKKVLLLLTFVAVITALFAISASAAEPVETWDISATEEDSVTAYLYENAENSGMYTLTVSGTGNMEDWSSYTQVPWYNSYRSKITAATVEKGITSIGSYAFIFCSSLTSITIGDSVTSIGSDVFYNCSSLTSINIPNGVTSIGSFAFYKCSSLTIYCEAESQPSGWDSYWNYSSRPVIWGIKDNGTLENGIVWIKLNDNTITVAGYVGDDNELTIPSIIKDCNVSVISNYAFYKCSSLTSITIPDSVTSIGSDAFYDCSSLTSINIPNSVTSISSYAFEGCSSLTSITIPDSVTSIGDSAFYKCSSLTSITIPDSVTSIGSSAFEYCSSLTSITIPNSVTSIGSNAFYSCSSLTSITIGDSVTSIGSNAFYYCSSLTSITIGDSVTSIGFGAFEYCSSLTSITIPDSVTSIGFSAFSSCSSLTSITIPDSVTSIGNYTFYNCSRLTIYCEAESQPEAWNTDWNPSARPVVWDYKNIMKKEIFVFKGYSIGPAGQVAFGYDINYEAKSAYEALTGDSLEFGAVFASYNNVGDNLPLDKNGNSINKKVLKVNLTEQTKQCYEFIISGLTGDKGDNKLCFTAYTFDGQDVKYHQESGISDTVTFISYNEIYESVMQAEN